MGSVRTSSCVNKDLYEMNVCDTNLPLPGKHTGVLLSVCDREQAVRKKEFLGIATFANLVLFQIRMKRQNFPLKENSGVGESRFSATETFHTFIFSLTC